ncbi:hypothetical protein FIBSPDRAFT_897598 [Athelia psychrophila]|uniref:Uncharacterized protein n=1 Tax=Athelia psychrophila TaxID=1759441 RepID=A0A166C268_9AGAM|nr:hypothetical protein FIBSPDRAFT_897598 [Fibularhizoctonia sp. CBS 109695]
MAVTAATGVYAPRGNALRRNLPFWVPREGKGPFKIGQGLGKSMDRRVEATSRQATSALYSTGQEAICLNLIGASGPADQAGYTPIPTPERISYKLSQDDFGRARAKKQPPLCIHGIMQRIINYNAKRHLLICSCRIRCSLRETPPQPEEVIHRRIRPCRLETDAPVRGRPGIEDRGRGNYYWPTEVSSTCARGEPLILRRAVISGWRGP